MWIITTPWFSKPVHGLLSDFGPLFGTRRRSDVPMMGALAPVAASAVSVMPEAP